MKDSPEEGSSVKIPGSYLCPEMAEKALGLQMLGFMLFIKMCVYEKEGNLQMTSMGYEACRDGFYRPGWNKNRSQ